MSTKLSAGRVRATYQFIKAHRDKYSVQALCRVLGVAPSGYYEWLTHPVSNRAQEDALIARAAAALADRSGSSWTCPPITSDLGGRKGGLDDATKGPAAPQEARGRNPETGPCGRSPTIEV